MADRPSFDTNELPEALPDNTGRSRLPLVWILPALVVLVGGFVVIREKLAQGPDINITFLNADGLEANKTKVRYKEVDIGDVKEVHVAKDRKHVVVTANIHKDAQEYLLSDSRFWVVKPRITAGNISGLGTLVSGSYIALDVGKSEERKKDFSGLETPPIVTSDLPGREYILHAEDIGSLEIGSTVYYRHMAAGQVVAYALDPGGASVTIKVFINAPYDTFVGVASRFWQASGVDMSLSSDGVKLRTESLASILEGGIAFQSIAGVTQTGSLPADSQFTLFSDQERAMRQPDTQVLTFIMYFRGSLRGLGPGATVDVRGITIGEVKKLSVEYEQEAGTLRFPVEVDIFPQRVRGLSKHTGRTPTDDNAQAASRALIDSLVAHGMRAELKTGSLLTGAKFVAMDVHPDAPLDIVGWNATPPVFPTTSGALDEIQDSVGVIAKKLSKVPMDQIAVRLLGTLADLEQTLKSADKTLQRLDTTVLPQAGATLKEAEAAMKSARDLLAQDSPLQSDLSATLQQLSRAAKSVSALVDYLERHPESLLRGKPGDEP